MKEAGKGAFGSVFQALELNKLSAMLPDQDAISQIHNLNQSMVAIKKLFYDRRYEQRELSTLDEIKDHGLCSNIIELRDKYFKTFDESDPKKQGS